MAAALFALYVLRHPPDAIKRVAEARAVAQQPSERHGRAVARGYGSSDSSPGLAAKNPAAATQAAGYRCPWCQGELAPWWVQPALATILMAPSRRTKWHHQMAPNGRRPHNSDNHADLPQVGCKKLKKGKYI